MRPSTPASPIFAPPSSAAAGVPLDRRNLAWRAAEALAVGVPVIALDTPVLRELVGDGGVVAAAGDLAAAVDGVIAAQSATLRTLAGDRGRTFSWLSAADKVWQLHADM